MEYQFFAELTQELETRFRPVVRDVCPVYPAMVGFVMTTQNGQEEFLLGCNTETGDWAIDRNLEERVAQFPNTENATIEEVVELFGDWLDTLKVEVTL